MNGNDSPRTFLCIALLVAAQAWVVMALAQGWEGALSMSLVVLGAWWLGAALYVLVRRAARRALGPGRGLSRPLVPPLVVGLGFLIGHWRGPPEDLITALAPGEGDRVTAIGTVIEVEHERGYTLDAVTLSAPTGERGLGHPLRVVAPPFDPPALGSSVRVEVELSRARVPLNPSTTPRLPPRPFAIATGEAQPHGEPSWAALASLHLRERLTFESPVATSLYRALLLGDRSDLPPEARFAYQDTGTAHLLAISGMNLALLGLGLFAVLRFSLLRFPPTRRWGQGRRLTALAALIALLSIAAYGRIIAPSDATDRAIIAFGLVAIGLILMRRPSGPRTVMLCALAALALDPLSALRPGFQLSFSATTALVLVAPPLASWRAAQLSRSETPPGWAHRVRIVLVLFLVANLVTSVATLPLGLAWFGQLPLHGLWVNLVAIPFMSLLVFPAGVLFAVLVTLIPPLFDLLAPLLVLLAEAFDAFILGAGELVGPSSTQAWPLSFALCSTVGLLMMIRSRLRFAGAGLTALAALAVSFARGHDDRLVLHVLDVGHGDAMALTLPDGQRAVIDVGGHLRPEANRVLAERVVLPSLLALGFERVDLLVLTHGDLDHAGAALALARRLRIGELWVPPCAMDVPLVAEAAAHIERQGGRVRVVARGPPLHWGGVELEVLWPPPDLERESGCAMRDNDASLVLRVAFGGRRLLLTGDIERPAEEALLLDDHRRDLPALRAPDLFADVLKSPHHGSRSSSTDALLDAVSPRFALVSGLPGRGHMPPHDSVLERYAERNITTCVTGESGALRLTLDRDGVLAVEPLGEQPCRQAQAELRPP